MLYTDGGSSTGRLSYDINLLPTLLLPRNYVVFGRLVPLYRGFVRSSPMKAESIVVVLTGKLHFFV